MADVELVIKIPEDKYLYAKSLVDKKQEKNPVILAIGKGIPLPKGYGNLVDVDEIGLTDFECIMCDGDFKKGMEMLIGKIESAHIIIEADKESGG